MTTFAYAFAGIDTERMTPTNPGRKMGARAWLVVAYVLLFVVWQLVRLVI
jgi:hypothetical protein